MKNSMLKCSVLAAVLMTMGCADETTTPEDTNPGDGSCSVTVCKDANTLNYCANGNVQEIPCKFGCDNNACKSTPSDPGTTTPTVCTATVCKDANTLTVCNNGVAADVPCPFGCENDACKSNTDPTPAGCTATVCKDANTLSVCNNGVATDTPCPNGCEINACKPAQETPVACTADYCRNATTLVACVNGFEKAVDCPNGCDSGKCKSSQTEPTCSDGAKQCSANGNLQTCVNGVWTETPCPNGCQNNACIGETPDKPECADGAKMCDKNTAKVCVNGKWETAEACQYGCNTNSGVCFVCNNGQTQCKKDDNKTLQTCTNGAWKESTCSIACSGGACTTATTCTNGAKQCNGVYVQSCQSGNWVNGEKCANGCENGACKSGSTTPTVDSCEYYDCTAQYGSQCKAQFGSNSALCNATQAFCTDRMASSDSKCANGKTAWDNGEGSAICLVVGSSAACLNSGTPSNPGEYEVCDANCKVNVNGTTMGCAQACKSVYGSDECYMDDESIYCEDPNGSTGPETPSDTYFACGDADIEAECKSQGKAAYCFSMAGATYYSCGATCTTIGSTTTLCDSDSSGSYTYPALCTQVGSNKVYVDNAQDMDDYVYCSGTCNAAGTACAAGGSTPDPSTTACDFYDCTSQYGSQCKSQFGASSALCNATQAFCTDRMTSSDSKCASGETAWDDGEGSAVCLVVGSSAACLTAGS